jgi:hypothetical protein
MLFCNYSILIIITITMGNSQLAGMMGTQDMAMAKVKSIMEEVQFAETQKFNTHGLSRTVAKAEHDEDEPTEPTPASEDSKDQPPASEDVPQPTTPTPATQKTEFDLFAEVFHKEYPTSTFQVVTTQKDDQDAEQTEVTLSDVDWFKILSQQAVILDTKLHKLLTVRSEIQVKTNEVASRLIPVPSKPVPQGTA